MLLIWDNFEAVRSLAVGHGLDDSEYDLLRSFVEAVHTRSASVLLVTSRTPEDWLGEVQRITVQGFASHEA